MSRPRPVYQADERSTAHEADAWVVYGWLLLNEFVEQLHFQWRVTLYNFCCAPRWIDDVVLTPHS
jgi:hypothetical protein